MKQFVFSTLLSLTLALTQHNAQTVPAFAKLSDATFILYKQGAAGEMQTLCTATAFSQKENTYQVLTAAHCVTEKRDNKLAVIKQPLFLTSDELNDKGFIRATIDRVGNTENGYDLAVLSITTDRKLRTVPLGDEKTEHDGAAITNVASPAGLGKVCFHGFIGKKVIDRPLQDTDQGIDWAGSMLLQVAVSGGSSGSAIFSLTQEKIVGVLVGTIKGHAIAVPISRLCNEDKENWIEVKK